MGERMAVSSRVLSGVLLSGNTDEDVGKLARQVERPMSWTSGVYARLQVGRLRRRRTREGRERL